MSAESLGALEPLPILCAASTQQCPQKVIGELGCRNPGSYPVSRASYPRSSGPVLVGSTTICSQQTSAISFSSRHHDWLPLFAQTF
eukprot:4873407-Amphidinium_carterae.1